MGKLEGQSVFPNQQLQQQLSERGSSRRGGSCGCCWWCWDVIRKELSFKCVAFAILSLGVLLSAVFWLLPRHSVNYGFDAKAEIKNSAVIQGYFVLDKPPSLLIPRIQNLEYDVVGEIGVPNSKVAILSMHESGVSNYTDVVFGVIPDPVNVQIDPVFLSLLKSSLIELFLKQSNLTFTTASVGQASCFEILKFPGKITVIPLQSAAIWQIQQTLFNFTLNNSISDIQDYFVEFRDQLKNGLHLTPYENVYVQITNEEGSTTDEPVIVQVAIMSDLGRLLPQRLRQLAQTIKYSAPSKNLGLNNTVFGKVKGVSLSSHMSGDIQPDPPIPSPAPAPAPVHGDFTTPSPSPSLLHSPPSYSPSPSPVVHTAPPPSPIVDPRIRPSAAPAPQFFPNSPSASPPRSTPYPVKTSPPPLPSILSPLPSVSFGSDPGQHDGKGTSPSHGPSPEKQASTGSSISKELSFYSILISFLLYWFC